MCLSCIQRRVMTCWPYWTFPGISWGNGAALLNVPALLIMTLIKRPGRIFDQKQNVGFTNWNGYILPLLYCYWILIWPGEFSCRYTDLVHIGTKTIVTKKKYKEPGHFTVLLLDPNLVTWIFLQVYRPSAYRN